jgi:Ca2+-binding RTX toxin-like protein
MSRRNRSLVLGLALLLGVAMIAPASALGSDGSLQPRAPSNDAFANAWPVGTTSPWTQNTTGATTEGGEWLGPCDGWSFGATVWYSMTVAQNSSVTVDTFGSSYDTIMAGYSGTGGSGTRFDCNDDSGAGTQSRLVFSAVPGVTYWIQIGGYNGATGNLTLNITRTPTGPANDMFANAQSLGSSTSANVSTAGATTQAGEPLATCEGNSFGATVWYSLTVAQNSSVTVDTFGSSYDTVLAVYTGAWGSLTRVICDDDTGAGTQSSVQFAAVPGTTYWIQVGGYKGTFGAGETGNLVLNITRTATGPAAPSNDNFAAAWAIGTGPGVTGHGNGGATTQAGEWLGPCEGNNFGATTWYSMTATANSQVTVNTRGANFDTVLAVYTGSSLASLTRLVCDDDISGTDYDSEVQFAAVPGTSYWIQVGGYNGATGTYPVNITRTPTGGGDVCRGQTATIVGTAGADVLHGTAARDVIVALGGNDTIYGYGGNDLICAGAGDDLVYGGGGRDRLYGEAGNDRLFGQAGNDRLFGQRGNDRLFGQTGDDVVNGHAGNDLLAGGPGYDVLRGGSGADTCQTGEAGVC